MSSTRARQAKAAIGGRAVTSYAPPESLSLEARRVWQAVVPRRARSAQRITLLRVGLEALDRADALRREIDSEGVMRLPLGLGAAQPHPLLTAERAARTQFLQIWKALDLTWDWDVDGAGSSNV